MAPQGVSDSFAPQYFVAGIGQNSMPAEDQTVFVGYEICWTPRPCPHCQTRIATAYGVIYEGPVTGTPDLDRKRKAVGEIYHHAQGDDCRRMFGSQEQLART